MRRVLRLVAWSGASLLSRHEEHARAAALISKLLDPCPPPWVVLGGTDPAAARALLEHGANARQVTPIRVEAARLAGMDLVDVEECARRLGRMRRLTGDPIVIDLVRWDDAEADDDSLRLFLKTLGDTGGTSALIGTDEARVVRLLGSVPFELIADSALPMDALVAAVRTAANGADAYLTEDAAEAIARRFPLHVDGLEHAMALARSRPKDYDADDPELARFTAACKEVAAEGISQLADRIEPVFNLDDVVLPADRKEQLVEIVDNVRLAPRVLDGWKFRDQLPYGRGVTALFFGPSGTGKTMAAIGIARRLGIQLLRLDLSRVVSKYIGDTEKNIDRVFTDAQRSGSAILIDEADALLGKRSEVKDAHDRYANIEVAYLLQRMEAYDGLAILTTNMRQNLDPAFLRRLRFIVDFPRPDAEAREKIWRQCLPDGLARARRRGVPPARAQDRPHRRAHPADHAARGVHRRGRRTRRSTSSTSRRPRAPSSPSSACRRSSSIWRRQGGPHEGRRASCASPRRCATGSRSALAASGVPGHGLRRAARRRRRERRGADSVPLPHRAERQPAQPRASRARRAARRRCSVFQNALPLDLYLPRHGRHDARRERGDAAAGARAS